MTRQTDVYAAAVVTWEALTGQRLFQADNEGAVVTAVLQSPILPPSELASHVPLAFDRVVMRGLERDPARRYPTAREMAVDLERCVGIAAASEVSEWVEGLAHEELAKRATRIAAIESASSPSSASSPALRSHRRDADHADQRSWPDVVQAQHEAAVGRLEHRGVADPPLVRRHRRAKTKLGFLAAVAGTAVAATLLDGGHRAP